MGYFAGVAPFYADQHLLHFSESERYAMVFDEKRQAESILQNLIAMTGVGSFRLKPPIPRWRIYRRSDLKWVVGAHKLDQNLSSDLKRSLPDIDVLFDPLNNLMWVFSPSLQHSAEFMWDEAKDSIDLLSTLNEDVALMQV